MGKTFVLSGLIRKRAELAGRLLDLERERVIIEAQMGDVDRALAIFGYGDNPGDIKPKRSNARLFKRMELSRSIHRIDADGVTRSHREVAVRLMTAKDMDLTDRRLVAKVVQSVRKQRGRARRRLNRAAQPTA
jgi:hypothetical protein